MLAAHCLPWHVTKSGAFRELLVEPLRGRVEIALTDASPRPGPSPLIFCQILPPPELLADASARLVWIPMWDNVARYDVWGDVPSHVRVVAFSDAVAERSEAAGLRTLRLRYFRDPSRLSPASWNEGTTVFYWNRVGLVGPRFLERLCAAVDARRLLFRAELDPGAPVELRYELPPRLGRTEVETVPWTSHEQHLEIVAAANVYLAPRIREGVGMTFVEAMSRGAAVLAYDGSTMNEYIRHGRTGYLFAPTVAERAVRRLSSKPTFALSARRSWSALRDADLAALGAGARTAQAEGFAQWQESLDRFAAFLVDW